MIRAELKIIVTVYHVICSHTFILNIVLTRPKHKTENKLMDPDDAPLASK